MSAPEGIARCGVQKKSVRQVCLADFLCPVLWLLLPDRALSGIYGVTMRWYAAGCIAPVYMNCRCVDMHAWFAAHIV